MPYAALKNVLLHCLDSCMPSLCSSDKYQNSNSANKSLWSLTLFLSPQQPPLLPLHSQTPTPTTAACRQPLKCVRLAISTALLHSLCSAWGSLSVSPTPSSSTLSPSGSFLWPHSTGHQINTWHSPTRCSGTPLGHFAEWQLYTYLGGGILISRPTWKLLGHGDVVYVHYCFPSIEPGPGE